MSYGDISNIGNPSAARVSVDEAPARKRLLARPAAARVVRRKPASVAEASAGAPPAAMEPMTPP
eukprot:5576630-Pyramimonas_sp.AAC.1